MSIDLARLALTERTDRRELFWRGSAQMLDDFPDAGGQALVLDSGATLDLGTWFNAAPVGWWRRLLGPGHVVLDVHGRGLLRVWRSVRGVASLVTSERIDGDWQTRLPRTDGVDWFWVDLTDDGMFRGATCFLDSVRWSAGRPARARVPATKAQAQRVTVVVPTYGREDDALDQVENLLGRGLEETVARVILIDQARTVRNAERAAEVFAAAGGRLTFIEQDNLGGSGGYTRGMLTSLEYPDDAVLLLDDDAQIEPEGLRRMLTLSGAAIRPTILGTPLLSAEDPTRLQALAEGVRKRGFVWGHADGVPDAGVELAGSSPSEWDFASPAARVDYSGWWGTLLPAGAVSELGLSAPFFLKWDDAEYGLRARAAGYAVATVPGTGTWHPTWAGLGTISSWSAWPLHRNRLATAAAYGAGRSVLLNSFVHQVKHILSLQYDTADLWDGALEQFLAGPEWLVSDLRTIRSRGQAIVDAGKQNSGSQIGDDLEQSHGSRVPISPDPSRPVALVAALTGLVRPTRRFKHVGRVPMDEYSWERGLGRDAVRIETSEGGARWLVRDPLRARRSLMRTARLHLAAARRWRDLQQTYARALPLSYDPQQWRTTIESERLL